MSNKVLGPIELGPNQLHRFYRGGASIAELRGAIHDDDYTPEDWVGSTTSAFGSESLGLTTLPDGRTLRDAIEADPAEFLGPEHVARFGPDPELLVKLLDAGERLPVHFHPDAAFSSRHLGSRHGKTEAWVIVEAGADALVHLGFAHAVEPGELRAWMDAQDTKALLSALNPVPVAAGDTIFVPAGTPHAIGAGILLVELQEPTDFSMLLEWKGFDIDGPGEGHLGLGFDLALQALDAALLSKERITELRASWGNSAGKGATPLFPPEAHSFFRAERIEGDADLGRSFAILVVLDGNGSLVTSKAGEIELRAGCTILVPWAAGEFTVNGSVSALRCFPPTP